MNRLECLKMADKCVNGNREEDYGSPENNFGTIAKMWNAYLHSVKKSDLDAHDVAAMMSLMKIARIASGNAKEDNWVDLAGYAACGAELETASTRK